MPSCVVKCCKSYSSKCSKKHGITYYRFPKDPFKAEKWVKIIREVREDPTWKLHETHRVCSKHFNEKTDFTETKCGYRKLSRDVVPHLELEPEPEPPADYPISSDDDEPLPPEEEDVAELKDYLKDDSVLGFDLNIFTDMFDSPKEKKFKKQIRKLNKAIEKYRKRIRLLMRMNSRLKTKKGYLTEALKELNNKYQKSRKKKKTRNVEVNTTDDIFFLRLGV